MSNAPRTTKPRRTLLSFAALFWAMPRTNEPRRTLLSYAAPLLSNATPWIYIMLYAGGWGEVCCVQHLHCGAVAVLAALPWVCGPPQRAQARLHRVHLSPSTRYRTDGMAHNWLVSVWIGIVTAVLRIRFLLNPYPDPEFQGNRIRIQGYDDQKFKTNTYGTAEFF